MRFKLYTSLALALVFTGLLAGPASAQSTIQPPRISCAASGCSTLYVKNSGGTILNGGHAVTVALSTTPHTLLTASQTSCAAPAYSACNFLVAGSTGTVSNTVSLATASVAGNTILAMIETSGTAITRISYPIQSGTLSLSALAGAKVYSGGTTSSYTPVDRTANLIVHSGTVPLGTASPSTVAVTGMSPAFTSTSTYTCTASPEGNTAAIAAGGVAITKVSGSAVSFFGPNGVTTVIDYVCIGY